MWCKRMIGPERKKPDAVACYQICKVRVSRARDVSAARAGKLDHVVVSKLQLLEESVREGALDGEDDETFEEILAKAACDRSESAAAREEEAAAAARQSRSYVEPAECFSLIQLQEGDAFDLLDKHIPMGAALVLTDPPYGVTKNPWDKALSEDQASNGSLCCAHHGCASGGGSFVLRASRHCSWPPAYDAH
jgi:hypothetical protein